MSIIIYWCNRQARRIRYGQFLRESRSIVRAGTPLLLSLRGTNMRTVETPSAAGTGWRRTLGQFYRMIEAIETSPLESLYDRVLRLEQEISALKRNLPIGSVDHE
jgi:hypothetical protein